MNWILFKKNAMNNRVIYSTNNIENIQSMKETEFITFIKKNFDIQDLEKFYKLLNSHILILLENNEFKTIKEFESDHTLLEKSMNLKDLEKPNIEKNKIKIFNKLIDSYKSKLAWK